ncbi:MAG: 50S ribosomal protein L21 [Aeriscardovia sp.]|nr:50S ribosomal protein L21 [Aeriscardovia sp.]MBQ9687990.1 50S ribosomal protein L21 [Aeriscardovia sp.]MBR2553328.1 50S ribosomal protein L21 [Aeriscardovia sp.]
MYAIVKAGGHQEKVEVGDEITVNRLAAKKGDKVEFPVVLFVDGSKTVIDTQDLEKIHVEGEVIDDEVKGPKVVIQKFHNKTGGARRQGHRQKLTTVKITKIA